MNLRLISLQEGKNQVSVTQELTAFWGLMFDKLSILKIASAVKSHQPTSQAELHKREVYPVTQLKCFSSTPRSSHPELLQLKKPVQTHPIGVTPPCAQNF